MFHKANLFGACIIHILYTGCAKIKKNNSGAKGLSSLCGRMWDFKNVTVGVACGYRWAYKLLAAECVNCGELIGERFLRG